MIQATHSSMYNEIALFLNLYLISYNCKTHKLQFIQI